MFFLLFSFHLFPIEDCPFSYHIHTFVDSRTQRGSGGSGAGMSGERPARRWKGNEEYE